MAVACPCGSGEGFAACCRPLLRGEREAATASALMRSRYTAYVRRDQEYLLRTWHPSTRPDLLELEGIRWRGLDVRAAVKGGESDTEGTVSFTALFEDAAGAAAAMHETSRFVRESRRWVYVDGDVD
ncbi:YchJ family protein [Demequina sp. SO4-18]|uniref:YchJ family protein n=1 Tax=Demequina sp. SO4-18 TaxID=3401026 RepID=UPI003B599DCC